MFKVPRLMLKQCGMNPRLRVGRNFHTTPKLNSPRKLARLKKLQADFQCDDGRPVFLKGGLKDRVLYGTTILLCVFGLFNNLLVIYNQAKPKSWNKTC